MQWIHDKKIATKIATGLTLPVAIVEEYCNPLRFASQIL